MSLRCDEAHPFPEAERLDHRVQRRQLRFAPWPARAADEDQLGFRDGADQEVERLEGDIRPLQGLDAPHEQQQGAVTGKAERPARVAPVAGREEGVIHPERHDLDTGLVSPVQVHQLIDLDRARGEQRVGAPDDLRLGSRRRPGSALSTSSGLASALTWSNVWNVETSGSSRRCLMAWPASPDSQ